MVMRRKPAARLTVLASIETSPDSSAPASARPAIPTLTGLRFFAAFFVVMGHAVTAFVTFTPEPYLLMVSTLSLLSIGMSLFFVLSGFVIHYNYLELLRRPSPRNLATFFTARLARLYPLFLFFTALDFGYAWQSVKLVALPFYIGFAQTWTYMLIDGRGMLLQLNYANITWSISTEWFFYCCYPLIAYWFFGERQKGRGPIFLIIATLLYMTLISLAYLNQGHIDQFAARHWGPHAAEAGMDSFFSWLVWFSPGRLHEFLTGVIAGHFFMSFQHRAVGRHEGWLGACLVFVSIVTLGALNVPGEFWHTLKLAAGSFLVPAAIGTILFCCARYRSLLARLLSARWLLVCGDASYSIYLFHVPLLAGLAAGRLPLTGFYELYAGTRFVLTAVLLIVVSIGFYRALELPARIWLRKSLGSHRSLAVDWAIICVCVGLPTTLAIVGWVFSIMGRPI